MKILILLFIVVIILPFLVNSQEVKIKIREILNLEIVDLKYNSELKSGEPLKIALKVFNSGSLGYRARVRLDILDGSDLYYTGWSKEVSLLPGDSEYFEIYSYPMNMSGNFTGKIRIYYANEIKEMKPIEFKILGDIIHKRNVQITDFKTYEDRIEVSLISNQDLKNVIIIPSEFPTGWIFEQSKIDGINKNEQKKIELKYEPTIWKPTEVTIHVFTEDGRQYTSKSFLMEKEKPTFNFISYFIKIFRIFSILPLV